MTGGHPEGLPDLFLDRSLGRHLVPAALRALDLRLHTLAEVYGTPADENVADVDWLTLAGIRGWPVLMKDERIRYRNAEREALMTSQVRAFCLTGGNLRAAQTADRFANAIDDIAAACAEPGPFLYVVSSAGLRRISL
jgi:hypothetical protein